MIVAQIIFWSFIFLLAYTYVIYPAFLLIVGKFFKDNKDTYILETDLPKISILMSVYNEEKIIQEKIESVFTTNYPLSKIELIIGSDKSTDQTHSIINDLKNTFPEINLVINTERKGKIKTINSLITKADGDILILTDAKAIFTPNTIFELVKHFKNPKISIVGSNIVSKQKSKKGSGLQETFYMNYENKLKYLEGLIFKRTLGVFGACYAIRKKDFEQVPEHLLVDDLYTSLDCMSKKKHVIYSKEAIVFENVTPEIKEEFRRKKRIATGDFQVLKIFIKYLFLPFTKTGFCFISHKVIRWIGFFLLFSVLLLNIPLANEHIIYTILMFSQLFFYLSPLIDKCLRKFKIQIIPLRFVTHFVYMNIAMFIGFITFIKGVKTNVWEPTKR